jgi:hypothetical protein
VTETAAARDLLVAILAADAEVLLNLAVPASQDTPIPEEKEALARVGKALSDVLSDAPHADAAAAPEPPGRLARIEVKGFRNLGIVRVTETTFAGEPMVHAERTPWSSEEFTGDAADFPASSLHFATWLPEPAAAVMEAGSQVVRAIAHGGAGCDDLDDEPYPDGPF